MKCQGGIVDAQQLIENAEICLSGLTLQPAQHFRRWFFLQLVEDALQPFMGMGQIVIRNVRIAFSMIPKSTTENGALVVHLADQYVAHNGGAASRIISAPVLFAPQQYIAGHGAFDPGQDRKSTRLNSSHVKISYAVFCLKK